MFEQLGQTLLEAAVTTDIAGKKDAHAVRLDAEAINGIKKARLHRKVATTIFFESNGGQVGSEAQEASIPEIRLAVGEPESDIGNIETVLEALTDSCYYLNVEKTRYKFSLKENLNKRFADRRATVQGGQIDEEVKREIQKIFAPGNSSSGFSSPRKQHSNLRPAGDHVPDRRPEPHHGRREGNARFRRPDGEGMRHSARTFKSALIWVVADSAQPMREEARKILAWQAISDEYRSQAGRGAEKAARREHPERPVAT
jgi:hypothetical protein